MGKYTITELFDEDAEGKRYPKWYVVDDHGNWEKPFYSLEEAQKEKRRLEKKAEDEE